MRERSLVQGQAARSLASQQLTYWHEGILRNVTLNEYAFDVLPDAKRIGFHLRTP